MRLGVLYPEKVSPPRLTVIALTGVVGVGDYFFLGLRFLAVLAESLKSLAVGAPFAPGLRIFSPDPAAMRLRFALMLAYKPRFLRMDLAAFSPMLLLFGALAFGLLLTAVAVMSGH